MENTNERAQRFEEIGFARFDAGLWSEAEEAFRFVAMVRPDRPNAWIGLGSALARQDRHEEAGLVFSIGCLAAIDDPWPSLLAAEAFVACGRVDRAGSVLGLFSRFEERGQVTVEQSEAAAVLRGLAGVGRP